MKATFWVFDGNNIYDAKNTYEQALEAYKTLRNCKECYNCSKNVLTVTVLIVKTA